MLIRFDTFAGANKALHPLLIPEGVGVDSVNQRPGRGDLRPWKAASGVAAVPAGTKTIYRMGRDAVSDTSYWLVWQTDVDVARGFIADDTTERTFWTGDGPPKWTDNTMGLTSPPYPDSSGVRILGVPQPNATPTLTQQAVGTGDDETRAYVVTWVNDHGEESMPSPGASITCKPGATIRVTRAAGVPTGAYGLVSWRVYRTVAGNENDYYYVGEAPAATAYIDESGTINMASALLSETWVMPPAELKGLKVLWNGIMAGFLGKSLRFCDPFHPFAWPEQYELLLDDTIVAIARWRQQLIVLTVNQPYLVTGSSPDAMSVQPIEMHQSCVSKLGVVEFGHGVMWPSPDGLAYIGDGGASLMTNGIAKRSDWQAMAPASLVAGEQEGWYIGSYDPGTGRRSFVLDPLNPTGFYFCDNAFVASYRDPLADALFVLEGINIEKWDVGSMLTASFESRTYLLPRPTCFGWAQVTADAYPVTLSIWADDVLRVSGYAVPDKHAFRLPAGFVAEQWRIRLATTAPVQAALLANSIDEINST